MRLQLELSDDLYDEVVAAANARKQSPEEEIKARLNRFLDVPLTERVILVRADIRQHLEARLCQGSHIIDANHLLKLVRDLADVSIGKVPVIFSPNEVEELHRRARKRGVPVKDVIEATVRGMRDQFFSGLRE